MLSAGGLYYWDWINPRGWDREGSVNPDPEKAVITSEEDTARRQYALREAAMSGDIEKLRTLKMKDVELTSKFGGWSLLHSACWAGQLAAVEYLLEEGLDPWERDLGGSNCLHLVARRGHLEVARLLLRTSGHRLDAPGARGSTPLHLAVRRGHTALVQLLLENHANVNLTDHSGRTPVDWAVMSNQHLIIRVINDFGGHS